jgi:hypothetical protein
VCFILREYHIRNAGRQTLIYCFNPKIIIECSMVYKEMQKKAEQSNVSSVHTKYSVSSSAISSP